MTNRSQEVPQEELKILEYLVEVRAFLSKLKQNRDKFLNSTDVQRTYQEVLTKVRELDAIRKKEHGAEVAGSAGAARTTPTLIHNAQLHNRVDSVLDDVFQLVSLCFLTVGLKNSAPATYASLSTVQSLLEHLTESKIFTHHDLRPIKERLDEISKIVDESCSEERTEGDIDKDDASIDGDAELSAEFRKIDTERNKNKIEQDLLLKAKLQHCLDLYNDIESKLESIDPSLESLMEKLFQIRRNLLSLVTLSKKNLTFPANDDKVTSLVADQSTQAAAANKVSHEIVDKKLAALQTELAGLENNRDENGNFRSLETNLATDKGQNVLNGLIDDCHDLINDLSHHPGNDQDNNTIALFNDPELQRIYDELIDIKTTLENLMITRRWTLRETDLFTYQKRLGAIDSKRVDGKFPASDANTANSKGQAILLYLLGRCYTIIYKLLESSEPVSESLQPIHNQLSTVRRCLLDLKRMGGVDSERELYPYIMKLTSLDNMRKDGKFYDSDGNIPEGQGILNALLASCFDIMHELKIEAEEREENGEGGDSDSEDNYEEGNDYY